MWRNDGRIPTARDSFAKPGFDVAKCIRSVIVEDQAQGYAFRNLTIEAAWNSRKLLMAAYDRSAMFPTGVLKPFARTVHC
jgi:hypothetical protein